MTTSKKQETKTSSKDTSKSKPKIMKKKTPQGHSFTRVDN